MRELVKTIRNIYSVEELKKRINYTLLLILVYRIGSYIILPGIDPGRLASGGGGGSGILDLINMFAGGAFNRASIMSLGIMPYISASIVMQLMGLAVPAVQKMQREGESGRKKIQKYTRYLTIVICIFQAPSYLSLYAQGAIINPSAWFYIQSIAILTAGTMFVTWLGERITDRGVGNGVSLIIAIGILANMPMAIFGEFAAKLSDGGMVLLLVEIAALFFVILACVLLVQGTRRIPVHSAKRIVNQRGGRQAVAQGQRSYIPLKINQAGVMPIIFAQALMFLPGLIFSNTSSFSDPSRFGYNAVFFILIVLFTYFYTAITMNPNQMADELKRNGAFIPGVKPGKNTAEFIDSLLSRLILPGSIFLGFIAILPAFAMAANIQQAFAYFYGGTSLLIMVGVVLDTLQQVESYLLNNEYDGLMKGGKMKGRNTNVAPVTVPQTI